MSIVADQSAMEELRGYAAAHGDPTVWAPAEVERYLEIAATGRPWLAESGTPGLLVGWVPPVRRPQSGRCPWVVAHWSGLVVARAACYRDALDAARRLLGLADWAGPAGKVTGTPGLAARAEAVLAGRVSLRLPGAGVTA
ncbi:hypothetical protein [Streptomyces albus]|uniref:hypothetical protein n=1 Tax=Streptomyces albus TaxID=1888 RepID=UPI003F199C7E